MVKWEELRRSSRGLFQGTIPALDWEINNGNLSQYRWCRRGSNRVPPEHKFTWKLQSSC